MPALVGLAGAVLVAASPQRPGVAVRLVAAGFGDDGAAELSQQLRYGDGDQFEDAGAAVRDALVSAVWSGIISACLSTTSYGVVNAHIPSADSLAP